MLIDIHTHQKNDKHLAIFNLIARKENSYQWDPKFSYSIGIHPWFPEQFFEDKEKIAQIAALPQIKAIGECGLDKLTQLPLEQQTEIFLWHLQLAETLKKPLIIHCVKAYNELLHIKRTHKSSVPWILHGFNASEPIIQQCIRENFYFSAGHLIFDSKSSIYKNIALIPWNRIFLETDESNISIGEIYSQYSLLTGIPEKDVEQLIYSNFVNCFNITEISI